MLHFPVVYFSHIRSLLTLHTYKSYIIICIDVCVWCVYMGANVAITNSDGMAVNRNLEHVLIYTHISGSYLCFSLFFLSLLILLFYKWDTTSSFRARFIGTIHYVCSIYLLYYIIFIIIINYSCFVLVSRIPRGIGKMQTSILPIENALFTVPSTCDATNLRLNRIFWFSKYKFRFTPFFRNSSNDFIRFFYSCNHHLADIYNSYCSQ